MNSKILIAVLTVAVLATGGGLALLNSSAQDDGIDRQANLALSTASFNVSNMTCATCPATVKAAMSRVAGVKSVEVEFETALATVVFDSALASASQIAEASNSVGFPATPVI